MTFYPGVFAEFYARSHANSHPKQSTDHAVGQKRDVAHRSDSCDKGRECANNGSEAGKDNRFRSLSCKECLCLFKMFAFDKANLAFDSTLSDGSPDPIVYVVTEKRRNQKDQYNRNGL